MFAGKIIFLIDGAVAGNAHHYRIFNSFFICFRQCTRMRQCNYANIFIGCCAISICIAAEQFAFS